MVSQCRPPAHLSTTNHVVLASHRIPFTLDTIRTHALPFIWAPVFYWKDTAFYNCTMYLVNPSIPLYTPVCPFIPRYTTFESHFFPLCESESLLLVISWHQNWYCGYAIYYFYCGYCGCIPVGIVGIVHTAPSKLLATSQLSPVCITNTFSSNLSLNTFVNSPLNAVGIVHTMPMCETCNAQNTQGLSALLESYLRYASKVVSNNVACPKVYWTTGQISNGVQCALWNL